MLKSLIAVLAVSVNVALAAGISHAPSPQACLSPGHWFTPKGERTSAIAMPQLLAGLADKRVVLLGEHHDDADHHRWQLQVIAALHAQRPNLVIGMEMLPRRAQPVLDAWSAGKLTEAELLRQTDWARVWGIDPGLYLPILHFARLNRIPVIGINVNRKVIDAINDKGLTALSAAEREGIGTPAPPTPAYREELAHVSRQHGRHAEDDAGVARFIEAQLFWDRAFAEGLAAAARKPDKPLVVGIMGSGHLRSGAGVPLQLADLGVADSAVLLPVDADLACDELLPGIADAVFAVAPSPVTTPTRPRLGVLLEADADGVRIAEVTAGSVADQAGLKAGDVVRKVASRPVKNRDDVTRTVARQAPGTWLPLKVTRNGSQLDLVAKFPPEP